MKNKRSLLESCATLGLRADLRTDLCSPRHDLVSALLRDGCMLVEIGERNGEMHALSIMVKNVKLEEVLINLEYLRIAFVACEIAPRIDKSAPGHVSARALLD